MSVIVSEVSPNSSLVFFLILVTVDSRGRKCIFISLVLFILFFVFSTPFM